MSGISRTKKRKAYDGRATTASVDTHDVQTNGGGWSPPTQSCYGNLSQMDTMMQIMLRMEEKCNRLEEKCNSLENRLESNSQSMKEQVDSLHAKIDVTVNQNEYNNMLMRNQSWEYPALVHTVGYWMNHGYGYEENEAEYLSKTSKRLKEVTESLRRGEFPDNEFRWGRYYSKGISLDLLFDSSGQIVELYRPLYGDLLRHWNEFIEALKQFTPAFGVLPDGCKSFLRFHGVQMSSSVMYCVRDALMNKPFQSLCFSGDRRLPGMSVDAIVSIMRSNKHLRELHMDGNLVSRGDIRDICCSVHNHPSLVDLDLSNCFEDEIGLGDEMLTSLLTNGELKLENLNMSHNGITSNVSRLLSDFLATDPPLKYFELEQNQLNDNDAALLANALRSNTTLRQFDVSESSITDVGNEAFRLVLNDDSTLNAVSDTNQNHTCYVYADGHNDVDWNSNICSDRERNRGGKIYELLSSRHRHESVSNVQFFGDIDVKLLPNMVEAVQKYVGLPGHIFVVRPFRLCMK